MPQPSRRLWGGLALIVSVAAVAVAAGLGLGETAAPVTSDISSSGPIDNLWVSTDLSCQAHYAGAEFNAMFPAEITPGDCGTLLAVGGAIFAPDFNSHDGTSTFLLGDRIPFTPVSQALTGTGTAGDPYTITTVVDAGATKLRLTETDIYAVGDTQFHTAISVHNSDTKARTVVLYRAASCFVADDWMGYGFSDAATHAVGCSQSPNNAPPSPMMAFVPDAAGAHFVEDYFQTMWSTIALQGDLPDTCQCAFSFQDGMALSWKLTLAGGATSSVGHTVVFSNMPDPATPTPTATDVPANTATPTPTDTPQPTATDTPAPTNTPAPTDTATPTNTPVPTDTATPTNTATNTATATPTATNTAAPTSTATPTPTSTNTPVPTATNTLVPTSTNTATATATRTNTPVPTATRTDTPVPTNTPDPPATKTSVPTATNTPDPPATKTPVPTATNTPDTGRGRKPTNTPKPKHEPTSTPTPQPCADVTGDGVVTVRDLADVARHMGRRHQDLRYDVNHDGRVDVADLLMTLRQLGQHCGA